MSKPYHTALKNLFDSGPLPKLGLERMRALMLALGNPQDTYPIFHVAGTNGKGSTCAFLESILRAAGYKTGLYTSPHLTCARERIQVNRELISESDFVRLEQQVPQDGTFFERITAMAFLYFAEQKVDVAVIEVGLGGRLDATNIVNPIVCGISRIDLDHQAILGDTLEKIAFEKEGIIKPGVPVCRSPQKPVGDFNLGLQGAHQLENASLAVSMIRASGFPVSEAAIQAGLEKTQWPCRYELVCENPMILIDGAHNPGGTRVLIQAIREDARFQNRELILWVGLTEGHAAQEIAEAWFEFAPQARVFTGQSKSLRALPASEVAAYFKNAGFLSPLLLGEGDFSLLKSGEGSLVVITGSLYWAGEIRSRLISMPIDTISTYY